MVVGGMELSPRCEKPVVCIYVLASELLYFESDMEHFFNEQF